jgi:hypothetical protein
MLWLCGASGLAGGGAASTGDGMRSTYGCYMTCWRGLWLHNWVSKVCERVSCRSGVRRGVIKVSTGDHMGK